MRGEEVVASWRTSIQLIKDRAWALL